MAKNDAHPLFRKDEELVHEFNDWFFHATAHLADLPKKRQALETLDRTNAIARDAKVKTVAELDMLDKAHGVAPDGTPPQAATSPNPPTAGDAAYQKQRADIFTRYATVTDRLWKQREALGADLDRSIDRQDVAPPRSRVRMPPRIIQAARISSTQHQAHPASAYDRLMQKPAPQAAQSASNRTRDQERE